jgi:hypothetical protein
MSEPGAPGSPEPKPAKAPKGRVSFPLACAAAACLALVALVLQSLGENVRPLLDELRHGEYLLPILALGGVALVVAVVVLVLLIKWLKRLLLSLRMIAAVLLLLALLVAVGQLAGPEQLAAGRPAAAPGAFQAAGERLLALIRAVHLPEPGECWAFLALTGFLALASAAGIVWRRPVGNREFGYLAAHFGLLLVLGGMAFRPVFGRFQPDLRMVPDAPAPISGGLGAGPDFSVKLLRLELEPRTPGLQLMAAPAGAGAEKLDLDCTRPGKIRWRDLDVAVLELRPDAAPEMYVENQPGRSAQPAVRVTLTGLQANAPPLELILPPGGYTYPGSAQMGLAASYERYDSAKQADAACRREITVLPERLAVLNADGAERDGIDLPPGRSKNGCMFQLQQLGVRLKVLRYFPGSAVSADGSVAEAPAGEKNPPAIALEPVRTAPGNEKPEPFWVIGGPGPAKPLGKAPAELAGMDFLFNPPPLPGPAVRVVEGPIGTFRAVELLEGRPVSVRPLPVGGELPAFGDMRLKLVEFIPAAQAAWRPAAESGRGPGRLAVHLAVVGEGKPREFWLFPGWSPPYEVFDAVFSVRALDRGLRRAAAVLELAGKRGLVGERVVELGRPLRYRGWQITLRELQPTRQIGGRQLGTARLAIGRDPAIWAVYAGMLLLAIGAPWLLWTRLRRESEPVVWPEE